MKIIIDIPEESYKRICSHTDRTSDMMVLLTASENAVPLDNVIAEIKTEMSKTVNYKLNEGLRQALIILNKHLYGDKYREGETL